LKEPVRRQISQRGTLAQRGDIFLPGMTTFTSRERTLIKVDGGVRSLSKKKLQAIYQERANKNNGRRISVKRSLGGKKSLGGST